MVWLQGCTPDPFPMVSQLGTFQPDPTPAPAGPSASNLPWFPNEIASPAVGQLMSISPALVLFSPLLRTSHKHYPSIQASVTAFHVLNMPSILGASHLVLLALVKFQPLTYIYGLAYLYICLPGRFPSNTMPYHLLGRYLTWQTLWRESFNVG